MLSDFDAEEACGSDTYDLKGVTVEGEFLANCVRVAAVFALPERITDHRARRTAPGPVVILREDTAE